MIVGMKRCGLGQQLVNQFNGFDVGIGRNVENRFFRVQSRALAPGHIQNIHHVAFEPQHSALKHREQANGAGANDDNIGRTA